jgi:2-polyprenyl-6-methoxyphenol hydroxylase-like FAD-dependent oxidoreductase
VQQQQPMSSRRILVVSGGIAGFAMVRALAQRGIAATVVDRLSGPPDAGLGLNLPGNAVRALDGVGDGLRERSMPVLRREYRNARDRLLLATRDDWGRVGDEFEHRRQPRVEHVRKMTDRLSRAAGLPGWLRDAILPVLGPRTYRETYGPLREPVISTES